MSTAPHHLAELGVIIVAAGSGERLGAQQPKAFVDLGERTLLEHALSIVVSLPHPGHAVLVVPDGYAARALRIADGCAGDESGWQVSVVSGGRERHESVRNGLAALHASVTTVLVHDAARPLMPAEVYERVIAAVHETGDSVVPVIPIADTVKRVEGAHVVATVDRASLRAAQTPQGFPHEVLASAHDTAAREAGAEFVPTDDAEVVQQHGAAVRTVMGSGLGHKVTTPADLLMLEGLLDHVAVSTAETE